MLSTKLRNKTFDKLSSVTMRRFFTPISISTTSDLVKEVCLQSERDFFINGTITCHAAAPQIMAGMWVGGREVALTNMKLPAWLKKAMGAALSEVNKCPYCEDMLLSLTYGARQDNVARSLSKNEVGSVSDELTQKRLRWTKASITRSSPELNAPPFSEEEMPEALGTLVVFNYTNKISDFTMGGSPVPGLLRDGALKLFGVELRDSSSLDLEHGASLDFLPEVQISDEFQWAVSNPLVADSLSRWNHVVETGINDVLSQDTLHQIRENLKSWQGGQMGLSRAWVEDEIQAIRDDEKNKARIALLVSKASYQIDDGVIETVVQEGLSEADLIKLGAWSALLAAKTVSNWCAR